MDALLTESRLGDLADLALGQGDLLQDHGLQTAVLLSLFSDAYSDDETLEDRRGYWGDQDGDRFGSLLWTLEREKATNETAERARGFTERSLRWLIDDDIVQTVTVEATYPEHSQLRLDVRLTRGTARGWSHIWQSFTEFEDSWKGGVLVVRAS